MIQVDLEGGEKTVASLQKAVKKRQLGGGTLPGGRASSVQAVVARVLKILSISAFN